MSNNSAEGGRRKYRSTFGLMNVFIPEAGTRSNVFAWLTEWERALNTSVSVLGPSDLPRDIDRFAAVHNVFRCGISEPHGMEAYEREGRLRLVSCLGRPAPP